MTLEQVPYNCDLQMGKDAVAKKFSDEGNLSVDQCIIKCAEKKASNSKINGVTVRRSAEQHSCFCNEGMTGFANEYQLKSCYLTAKAGGKRDETDKSDESNKLKSIYRKLRELEDALQKMS